MVFVTIKGINPPHTERSEISGGSLGASSPLSSPIPAPDSWMAGLGASLLSFAESLWHLSQESFTLGPDFNHRRTFLRQTRTTGRCLLLPPFAQGHPLKVLQSSCLIFTRHLAAFLSRRQIGVEFTFPWTLSSGKAALGSHLLAWDMVPLPPGRGHVTAGRSLRTFLL